MRYIHIHSVSTLHVLLPRHSVNLQDHGVASFHYAMKELTTLVSQGVSNLPFLDTVLQTKLVVFTNSHSTCILLCALLLS